MTEGRLSILLSALAALLLAACNGGTADTTPGTSPDTTGAAGGTLRILSHDSFAGGVDDETFAAFTEETGFTVEVVAAGDAGGAVNQEILTKDNPVADVLFGSTTRSSAGAGRRRSSPTIPALDRVDHG